MRREFLMFPTEVIHIVPKEIVGTLELENFLAEVLQHFVTLINQLLLWWFARLLLFFLTVANRSNRGWNCRSCCSRSSSAASTTTAEGSTLLGRHTSLVGLNGSHFGILETLLQRSQLAVNTGLFFRFLECLLVLGTLQSTTHRLLHHNRRLYALGKHHHLHKRSPSRLNLNRRLFTSQSNQFTFGIDTTDPTLNRNEASLGIQVVPTRNDTTSIGLRPNRSISKFPKLGSCCKASGHTFNFIRKDAECIQPFCLKIFQRTRSKVHTRLSTFKGQLYFSVLFRRRSGFQQGGQHTRHSITISCLIRF
mmetsp:Transcript_48441/g.72245  ORF Transcript_48441/g.72245 Transcript_48441/m.72245 type:complete len:307 (-) Transcript_48441:1413-2333(-)